MRCLIVLGCVVSLGCATPHPESARPATESVRVVGEAGMGSMRMSSGDGAARVDVAYAPDAVWGILPAIYDSLGIPVASIDPARRMIGNPGFKAHQRLGKTMLGKYIDCGRAQGFPSADSYDIYLSITSHVTSGKTQSSTSLSTLVEAAGRPMAFSGEYTKCSTLGVLESTINDAVRKKLASR